ncbi:MAG: polyprenyl synthetase family protein [Pseudomonadota bacterium]
MESELLEAALTHLKKSPGKRLRPQLVEAASKACGGGPTEAASEAIELIHTYSLVHDDLPAMDDDDMRRGQATLHVAFDEATAILVGDGLQTRAFEVLAGDENLSARQRIDLISCLANAAGFAGMVAGQAIDIASSEAAMELNDLKKMHSLKTGALIVAALEMGAIVAGGTLEQKQVLRAVGSKIGLAFQIVDDVIDVQGSEVALGKTPGKDASAGKTTYVSLMGLEAAEKQAATLLDEALGLLASWDDEVSQLRGLLVKLVNRTS